MITDYLLVNILKTNLITIQPSFNGLERLDIFQLSQLEAISLGQLVAGFWLASKQNNHQHAEFDVVEIYTSSFR
jgi:hypothetical protein